MKTRERKQEDLKVLTEQFKDSTSAMVLSFNGLTVDKDQAFRNELRETGATYRVVKNTLARIAAEGTVLEEAKEHFKGVTSVATSNEEPVGMSKVIAKYVKENKDIFEFKAGVVDGKVIEFSEVQKIATLPSKEELIGKLLFLLNAPAQRLATVLNAIPRDLAIVMKQVSERTDNLPGGDAKAEEPKEEPKAEEKTEAPAEEAKAEEKPAEESADTKEEVPKAEEKTEEKAEAKSDEQKEEPAAEEKAEDSE